MLYLSSVINQLLLARHRPVEGLTDVESEPTLPRKSRNDLHISLSTRPCSFRWAIINTGAMPLLKFPKFSLCFTFDVEAANPRNVLCTLGAINYRYRSLGQCQRMIFAFKGICWECGFFLVWEVVSVLIANYSREISANLLVNLIYPRSLVSVVFRIEVTFSLGRFIHAPFALVRHFSLET